MVKSIKKKASKPKKAVMPKKAVKPKKQTKAKASEGISIDELMELANKGLFKKKPKVVKTKQRSKGN